MLLTLKLRYQMQRVMWPLVVFTLIYFGIARITGIDNFALVFLPLVFASQLAGLVAFVIQRRNAGNLILTYTRNNRSKVNGLVSVFVLLLMVYLLSFPNMRTYPGGEPVYDERYYQEKLPMSIVFGLLCFAYIPIIFRKGEFFENGIATPDLQYYPWNNYSSYKWVENTSKKSDQPMTLFLQGEKGISHTIYGFSESMTPILDEILSTKLKKISS